MSENNLKHVKLIIVMGVSGSGKSTVAEKYANDNNVPYIEADDFHSDRAKDMMKNGIPLTDDIRKPWIERICYHLVEKSTVTGCFVLAYSGLRAEHRQMFRNLEMNLTFVYLRVNKKTIKSRLETRQAHFFNSTLLDSQFAALQDPVQEKDVITIDGEGSVKEILQKITIK